MFGARQLAVFLKGSSFSTTLPKMSPLLVAFDFDHTIVDDNSDIVVRGLLKTKLPDSQKKGWTAYMQETFNQLAAQGVTESEIRKVIVNIKEVPGFSKLLDFLKSINAEVIIISDANEYFINQWLKTKGMQQKVNKVFTNPASFKDGQLQIEKYHVQDWCKLSSENLCKGYILENYINERKMEGVTFDRVLYVGDGNNDYCPSTKLNQNDITFPRKEYALMKKILQLGDQADIKAVIQPWQTHKDILQFLKQNNLK